MIAPNSSDRLLVLEAELRSAIDAADAGVEIGVAVVEAGRLLIEAKGLLRPYLWQPWLRRLRRISPFSAHAYMRRARTCGPSYPRLPKDGEVMLAVVKQPTDELRDREFAVFVWRAPEQPGFLHTLLYETNFDTGVVIASKRPHRGWAVRAGLEPGRAARADRMAIPPARSVGRGPQGRNLRIARGDRCHPRMTASPGPRPGK